MCALCIAPKRQKKRRHLDSEQSFLRTYIAPLVISHVLVLWFQHMIPADIIPCTATTILQQSNSQRLGRRSKCPLGQIPLVRISPSAYSYGLFIALKLASGKRESASYQHSFDENRRAEAVLNPMRPRNEGTYRTSPVTTACPEDRWG